MRPIDADELLELYDFPPDYAEALRVPILVLLQNIRDMHTLDYAPVMHGEWKHFTTSEKTVRITNWLQCSVCGRMWDRLEGTKYNYCPSCGAKMDGGKKDG